MLSTPLKPPATYSESFKDNSLHALRTQIAVLTTVLRGSRRQERYQYHFPTSRSTQNDRQLRILSHICTLLETGSHHGKGGGEESAATGFIDANGIISIVLARNTSTHESPKSAVDVAIEGTDNGRALVEDWENHRYAQS